MQAGQGFELSTNLLDRRSSRRIVKLDRKTALTAPDGLFIRCYRKVDIGLAARSEPFYAKVPAAAMGELLDDPDHIFSFGNFARR
jgi:hypothetical protein